MNNQDDKPAVSVLTLVRDRQPHLDALASALARSSRKDIELVVAAMQPAPPRIDPHLPFPVSVVHVPGDKLPLAAARNRAARHARSDTLVFLDVDCIPSPSLVESYLTQLLVSGHCLLGEVRYLPGTVSREQIQGLPFSTLACHARKHPARPSLPEKGWVRESDRRALWGLSFALSREQYELAGGMDEGYYGYGGEETDFAERLAAAGVGLGWCCNALALHQHHPVCSPPLDKFDDIIRNASRFYRRWGSWCMEYWLGHFQARGLIEWSPQADRIVVRRRPAEAEIRAHQQPAEVAFA